MKNIILKCIFAYDLLEKFMFKLRFKILILIFV